MASDNANATAADVVGWTTGPGARGTLTLVWSCLITIFACTWTVLHLNVPGRQETSFTKTLRKLKWMAINILFPEFIFAKAVCDLRLALEELHQFDKNVRRTKKHCKWTVTRHDRCHEWVWEFEYPQYAHWLYRLLGLEPPQDVHPVAAAQSQESTQSDLQYSQNTDVRSDSQADMEAQIESRVQPSSTVADSPGPMQIGRAQHDPNDGPERVVHSYAQGQEPLLLLRTVQKWTVVHSYYAHMGGLLYPHAYKQTQSPKDEPSYYCLTASMLTARYYLSGDEHHPFDHLILTEKDIKDKSKADWVLKGIAVAQITWLILSVIVRSVMDLPIAQLEIATISFAAIAILSYAANWWKPKDISHATLLQSFCSGFTRNQDKQSSYTQPFILRLLSPAKAADKARAVDANLERVPNDFVWMEGESPLVIFLMAISSLGFGGLHCLAWNFDFPTHTELLCWRVASVTSAVLPVITLGISLGLSFLANSYADSRIVSIILRRLEPLGKTQKEHEEWWQLMKKPHFENWKFESQKLFVRTPAGERDWSQEPSAETIEEQRDSEPEHFPYYMYWNLFTEVQKFREHWEEALSYPNRSRTTALYRSWVREARALRSHAGNGTVELWREYEAFLRDTGSARSTPYLPNTTCIDLILQVCDEMLEEKSFWDSLRRFSEPASTVLTIASGIIYTAARLMNLVLMFTCLRRAPADIYQVTPWVELLPNFS